MQWPVLQYVRFIFAHQVDLASYAILLQDLDTEPGHDAGLPLGHLVTCIHGQCIHRGGALLPHLCHHGSAAVWGALLDLQ